MRDESGSRLHAVHGFLDQDDPAMALPHTKRDARQSSLAARRAQIGGPALRLRWQFAIGICDVGLVLRVELAELGEGVG